MSASNFSASLRNDLLAWMAGEKTWAQLEGFTAAEAREIAERACALAEAGRLDESRRLFEGLVEMNPYDSSNWSALGTVYQRLDLEAEAREAYDNALVLDERNPVAYGNRGELRLKQGDADGVDDLELAVRWDSEGKTAAARRARAILNALASMERRSAGGSPAVAAP